MNYVLIIILLFLAIMLCVGYRIGVVEEVIHLIGFAVAIFALALVATLFNSIVGKEISDSILAIIFLVLLAIVAGLIRAIGSIAGFIAKLPIIRKINQLIGALLGLVEGAIIIRIAYYFIKVLPLAGLQQIILNAANNNAFLNMLLQGDIYAMIGNI